MVSESMYIPASNVSIDEMIARFSGRTAETFRIKNKPTPEGYKILSLCDAGYTFTFVFSSRIKENPNIEKISGLGKIGNEVVHLVKNLPANRAFNIYMDNYFTSISLFKYFRDRGIGACGTVRKNSAKFPRVLKPKEKTNLIWNTLSGVVVDEVLALLWIDNGPVTMLTTIHEITGPNSKVAKIRRRPRITNTNRRAVAEVFGDQSKKLMDIPIVIDDYNHKMNGVDIADQLRSYYSTQLTARRTWVPLFFWLLDTVIVNSYLIYKRNNIITDGLPHKVFSLQLLWALIEDALKEEMDLGMTTRNNQQTSFASSSSSSRKLPYITVNSQLPNDRLTTGNHFVEWKEERYSCMLCRYLLLKTGQKTPLSNFWCTSCNVPLCCNSNRNCFKIYHEKENIYSNENEHGIV
jgi:hypothetical protein